MNNIYIYIYIYSYIYVYILAYRYIYITVQCLYLNISIKNDIKLLLTIHDWMESKKLPQDITTYFLTEYDRDINFQSLGFIFIHTY